MFHNTLTRPIENTKKYVRARLHSVRYAYLVSFLDSFASINRRLTDCWLRKRSHGWPPDALVLHNVTDSVPYALLFVALNGKTLATFVSIT